MAGVMEPRFAKPPRHPGPPTFGGSPIGAAAAGAISLRLTPRGMWRLDAGYCSGHVADPADNFRMVALGLFAGVHSAAAAEDLFYIWHHLRSKTPLMLNLLNYDPGPVLAVHAASLASVPHISALISYVHRATAVVTLT